MLRHLHIRNFAIAPELELDFSSGFTVITGETGAGKSILVDALGLLLGDRSDASWVRGGAERAELSAEFDLGEHEAAQTWLRQAELESGDRCLLRRTIAVNGRSRAWINGTPVTVQQLSELGERLVEIHGQNEHLALTSVRQQLDLLDDGGGYRAQLDALKQAFESWQALEASFAELEAASALSPAEIDLLRYQHGELEAEAISAAELAELEADHRRLSHSGEIMRSLGESLDRLDGEDMSLSDELSRTLAQLEPFESFDEEIAAARRLLEEAAINAREAASSLRQASDRIDLSPERLQAVRAQLDRLGDLSRKHQVPMEELAGHRDRLAERLERAEHFSEQREELERARQKALAEYRKKAKVLSGLRKEHARQLSDQVVALMAELGMAGGAFLFEIEHDAEARPSVRGTDRVQLLVSANPGIAPGPLAKIASGGELSRLSLAIKVASTGSEQRTQVFDEVDAGIGGGTAKAVGRLLYRLAADGQALCVTHLAQVAACAQHQVRVDKQVSDERVAVGTRVLEGDQRVREIARMLSGNASAQSLEHARELLSGAPA